MILTSSSASHGHNDAISRRVMAVAISPTKIRLAKFNRSDDDCRKRPNEYVDIGPQAGH